MRLVSVDRGVKFEILVVDLNDAASPVPDSPAKAFIESLPKASQTSMQAVIAAHKDHGPLMNEQKSRELEDGIYEFKNRQGARVFWFYLPGGRTVLTHGCRKPSAKQLKNEIEYAKGIRRQLGESKS